MRAMFSSLLFLIVVASNVSAAELEISGAWIRQAPPNAQVLVGFAQIKNNGDADIEITSVRSDDFSSVEIHEMRMDGEQMKMRRLPSLLIAAGKSVRLESGGKHLMLFSPKRSLTEGDQVAVELLTSKAQKLSVVFEVKK